jgi:hypothetical protein
MEITTQLLCQQCAAPLTVEAGSQFTICEYCGTTNYLDKSQAVLHYQVQPTINDQNAAAALRRWMAGNQTVKGLDQKAQITNQTFQLFPMWMARVEKRHGATVEEEVHLEPAAALSVINLTDLTLPAADLQAYDDSYDADAVKPTVPLTAVRSWLAEDKGVAAGAIKEISLVHLPIFIFKYSYSNESYTAVVDAATGQVFAVIFPAKKEAPYFTVGTVGCLVYFLAALIPLIGSSFGTLGLVIGVLLYFVVVGVIAVPLFAAASMVSQKV